jgi:ketosteroid isomerase-like protein
VQRVIRLGAIGALGVIAFVAALRLIVVRARDLARERSDRRTPDQSVRAAIARANRSYLDALIHNDPAGHADIFAEDCLYMPAAGPIVRGRVAVESNVSQTLRLMRFTGGEIASIEMHVDGDSVYEVGNYRFEVVARGCEKTLSGRYIGVWKRIGSDWKLAVDVAQPYTNS